MELKFKGTIIQNGDMDAAYIEVPYDIKEMFGKGRLLVNATFDGVSYSGQVCKMGTPFYIIGITKAIRKQIGKTFGDEIEVTLVERQKEDKPKATLWKCPKCGREFKNKDQSHYCGDKPKTIDEYLMTQDEDKLADLNLVRDTLRTALPEAEERISWSMPTYWKGHNIIHFAAFKKHIGLYPGAEAVAVFEEKLPGYKSSKGAIQIPYGKVDTNIIAEIAKWCWITDHHA